MNFRQITAAERTGTMFPLQAYAFQPSPWTDEEEAGYRRRMAFYETAVSMIAEEDGRALAGVGAFRMRQNVRGLVHDMAGVASVASHPSARRRGLVRELIHRLCGRCGRRAARSVPFIRFVQVSMLGSASSASRDIARRPSRRRGSII
jgi:predicted acetyltransferase